MNRIKIYSSMLVIILMGFGEVSSKKLPTSADYVVVGVGTSGAVVAKMLSDDMKTSVVALHSGKNRMKNPFIKYAENAPLVVTSALFNSPFFHEGQTTPQSNIDNRSVLWAIGEPLGGASAINAGAYCRGTNRTYAQWEAIAGENWSVNRILNIYKELETYTGVTPNLEFRGTHGPINVRQANLVTRISEVFSVAILTATLVPAVLDYNDPLTPIGADFRMQYTQQPSNGKFRVSSATAFLNNNVMKRNGVGVGKRKLRVLFEATGLRTLWDGNKAIGVEYMHDNKIKRVMANKGVIVCAGLMSSAFLMHSGVGPRAVLEPLNIPVKFDNPNVGQGLADQDRLNLFFSANPNDFPVAPGDENNYLNQIAWLPDPTGDPSVRFFHFATLSPAPGLVFGLLVLSPAYSRGSITINSANPLDPPVIDLGLLSDSRDLALLQRVLMITLKNINAQLTIMDPSYGLIYPDPAILNDINAVTAFIKENVGSNECFQSHCRMAPLDQGGVVRSTGEVHGVKKLWVADDSIVPASIDGTTMATAYLIGANIAKMILAKN